MEKSNIKEIVKSKYTEIALNQINSDCGCCCGPDNDIAYNLMNDDYNNIDGYVKESDLGLGCGTPTEFAGIKPGDTVLDLGSGAGNDSFIVAKIVGEAGKVTGIDMTQEMIAKANQNKDKFNFQNVEFIFGEIEEMPLNDNTYDVVISNCVINLVPDKEKAFSEIFRVLKPGGYFCISDVVIDGKLPESIKTVADLYTGCITGAINKDEYINNITSAGFSNIEIPKQKEINITPELLEKYLTSEQNEEYKKINSKILSITIKAYKD